VVFVDDTLDNVEAARAHGWNALHFVRTESWRTSIDDALAASRR
jgi:FMN phosphatase YigB (HAD superfamily)